MIIFQELLVHLKNLSSKIITTLVESYKVGKFDSTEFYLLWSLAKIAVDSGKKTEEALSQYKRTSCKPTIQQD